MAKMVLPIALYLCLTIGLALSLSIWNEWLSITQQMELDTYFILFGAITATVICVPNILTISKGLSIAAKVNLVTIHLFWLLVALILLLQMAALLLHL